MMPHRISNTLWALLLSLLVACSPACGQRPGTDTLDEASPQVVQMRERVRAVPADPATRAAAYETLHDELASEPTEAIAALKVIDVAEPAAISGRLAGLLAARLEDPARWARWRASWDQHQAEHPPTGRPGRARSVIVDVDVPDLAGAEAAVFWEERALVEGSKAMRVASSRRLREHDQSRFERVLAARIRGPDTFARRELRDLLTGIERAEQPALIAALALAHGELSRESPGEEELFHASVAMRRILRQSWETERLDPVLVDCLAAESRPTRERVGCTRALADLGDAETLVHFNGMEGDLPDAVAREVALARERLGGGE